MQAGLLRLGKDGGPEIVPCALARFSHRDLEAWSGEDAPVFPARATVAEKYEKWTSVATKLGLADPYRVLFDGVDPVTCIGSGTHVGFPVLTGQINAESKEEAKANRRRKGRPKYRDFLFHSSREHESFDVTSIDPAAWRDFLFIHGDEGGSTHRPWPGFWKRRFWEGERVPVFFLRRGSRIQIGLAYMPKLAGDYSVHDMIRHTADHHLDESRWDLASTLFGQVGATSDASLKSRVDFEMAIAAGEPTFAKPLVTILASPKPSYFPNYVKQGSGDPPPSRLDGPTPQYRTYIALKPNLRSSTGPELRGWKRFPARPADEVTAQAPTGSGEEGNQRIQVSLHPLEPPATFEGRIVFNNLKPEELGALAWALNFGGSERCVHSLGMGKPFGFGQVKLTPDFERMRIVPNAEGAGLTVSSAVERFRLFMNRSLKRTWQDSDQIRSLLSMADPTDRRSKFPGSLTYMVLTTSRNEFVEAKQAGLALAPFGTSGRSAGSETEQVVWERVRLRYQKGSQRLECEHAGQKATAIGEQATKLLGILDEASGKRLSAGRLDANVRVERNGNAWRIVDLEPIKPSQPPR